ncbi:MAG TPA: hypothetical protein VI874_01740, partial [Candidatus Norongarragalinales archaeon]|nr:hypothetical protein [Candidatus Norongarragalinales archaeon]
ILAKLGIEPMEVGVKIQKVYDHGTWYNADVLDIDDDAFKASLAQAHQEAVNLCVFTEVFNDESVPLLLQKAEREALAIQKTVDAKNAEASAPPS